MDVAHADGQALYVCARALQWPSVDKALDVIDSAFRLYGPDRVVVAFNGGKDATVVLHLARASLAHYCLKVAAPPQPPPPLTCLYLPSSTLTEFDEVASFVATTTESLSLNLHIVRDGGFAAAIAKFERGVGSDLLAFVMGTRHSDPDANGMEHFAPSTPGYPPFMRVNPILQWEYSDVWRFIRELHLSYCHLYDQGYTSIGAVEDTRPNPSLRGDDGNFRPPWTLRDPELERAGRENTRRDKDVKSRKESYKSSPLFPQTKIRNPFTSNFFQATTLSLKMLHSTNIYKIRRQKQSLQNRIQTSNDGVVGGLDSITV